MSRVILLGGEAASLVNFRGTLISELVKAGHQVYAAAPGISPRLAMHLKALGAQPLEAPITRTGMNPVKDLLSLFSLWKLMRKIRPDAVIAYTIKPVIYGTIAARLAGVKNIAALVTGLGYAFIEGSEPKRKVAFFLAKNLYRIALRFCRIVLFQNPDDLQVFYDLKILSVAAKTGIVNGSGVDIAYFADTPLPARPRFLMISRLLIDKGTREFGQAATALLARHPDAKIALAGPFDPSPNSIAPAELAEWQKNGVDYLGSLEDVRPEISASSIIVLPSYREGTPRVVLEAMSMGRAIITTDAPGCKETVIEGENGLLVPVRDAGALQNAMLRLYENPQLVARMGASSRHIAETRYDAILVARDVVQKAELGQFE